MTPAQSRRHRRAVVTTLVAVVVVVGLVVGVPWGYARLTDASEAAPLALAAQPHPSASPTETVEPVVDVASLDGDWTVGDGSEGGYRIDEVLAGEDVTAVGRTTEVVGGLAVRDGVLVRGEVAVDVASLRSDESARDAYLRLALSSDEHPLAVFTLTEPVDLAPLAATAEPVVLTAVGEVTLRGVARPATAELEARRTPEGVEVVGRAPVVLTEHGLKPPDLGFVSVAPTGAVEVRLRLERD